MSEPYQLKDALREWADLEDAAFHLARITGVIPADAAYADWKWMFWSRNDVGDALYEMLRALAAIGAIEEDPDDASRVRWSAGFTAEPAR
jgi:hypothetical protein